MKIIVGSRALIHHLPNFKRNNPDLDIWSDGPIEKCPNVDVSLIPTEILDAFSDNSKNLGIATPEDVMTIKLSHLPYDIFWRKHSSDYLVLKMKYGYEVNYSLYEKLKPYWKEKHGNKTYLSLYKTKDQFFDDFVEKKFEHDWLHELVAYPNKPIYTECLKDGQQVAIDKKKFDGIIHDKKIKMFREEMCVIALERWVIPSKKEISFIEAWSRSVHKTVTALTKGWASEFICENLELFVKPNLNDVKYLMSELYL